MNQSNLRLCLAIFILILTIGFGCSSGKAFKSGITYACDDEKSFVVEFYEKVDIAFLMVPGKTFYLYRVPSTSGTKYTDGDVTLWIKGESAFVEISSQTDFKNCSIKPK